MIRQTYGKRQVVRKEWLLNFVPSVSEIIILTVCRAQHKKEADYVTRRFNPELRMLSRAGAFGAGTPLSAISRIQLEHRVSWLKHKEEMKERRNNSDRASALQIALSTGL